MSTVAAKDPFYEAFSYDCFSDDANIDEKAKVIVKNVSNVLGYVPGVSLIIGTVRGIFATFLWAHAQNETEIARAKGHLVKSIFEISQLSLLVDVVLLVVKIWNTCWSKNIDSINSDDPIRNQLPIYAFSKKGILASQHLSYYLEKEKPINVDEIILWSFSQRKFNSRGQSCDTVWIPNNAILLNPSERFYALLIDGEGCALPQSAHGGAASFFLHAREIISIDECKRYECKAISNKSTFELLNKFLPSPIKNPENKLYIGYYSDGKCIIQQPAVRSCVPTALAMLLMDQEVNFDLKILFKTNLANDEDIKQWLKPHNYELFNIEKPNVKKISNWLKENGSMLASITIPDLGNHRIVIDSINDDQVTIRDPHHGWRVTFATSLLFDMSPDFQGIKKIS